MKKIKYLFVASAALMVLGGCSEDLMDTINHERNDATDMTAVNMLPAVEMQTAVQTAGTDLAWYASVYVEHNAGTWGQHSTADKRVAQNDASIFGNNWNSTYDILNTLKVIQTKCDVGGPEEGNNKVLGMSQVLTAYNLGVLTDLFGDVPFTESLQGVANMRPKFDKQQDLYPLIQSYLDKAIVNLGKSGKNPSGKDYFYGGNVGQWIKAAWALKARYYLRLSNVDVNAATNALTCIANAFSGNDDNFIFAKYDETAIGENPWYQFLNDRTHLSVSKNLFDVMTARNDPRIAVYFDVVEVSEDVFDYVPAPNGTAEQNQGGVYSVSLMSEDVSAPTPIMSFHELKFIEAEAKFRTGAADWKTSLQEAIAASFAYHGSNADAAAYFTAEVDPRLTAGNEIKEIITQKWIALYEAEAIEAYNDYRRTGFPAMTNPNNLTATGGFVNRYPYGLSEVTANGANVPKIDVFKDKVWWAK